MKTQHGKQDGDEQRIVVLDEALQERAVDVSDPKMTAAQLAAAAGAYSGERDRRFRCIVTGRAA